MTEPLHDDALRPTADGFSLRVSLPWIRSLPLSSVTGVGVLIDGTDAGPLKAVVDGRRVAVERLGEEPGWWFLQDRLELCGGAVLTPGAHEVEVSFTLSVPYLQAAPDAPLTLPFTSSRSFTLTEAPAAAGLPAGWTLGVSSFNWTPEILRAERPARDIVIDIAGRQVADTLELEAGQVWRSFPAPADTEVDALRDGLAAEGGSVAVVGLNLDDWASPTRRRTDDERYAFLVPQIEAARRVGATGVRLPIGQAGPVLQNRLLPLLHDLELTLFEEVQGQQTPQSPAHREACDAIVELDDPRLRFVVDISILMPALPASYLERLERAGVPAELVARLRNEWRDPTTHDAVIALLRSGGVPPAVHTLYMDLLIRFGRSSVDELSGILPFTGAVHLKFWDLDDEGGRVSQPIRDLAGALAATGFTGTLASEWGGHEWLDDDPTTMTRSHLSLARRALVEGLA